MNKEFQLYVFELEGSTETSLQPGTNKNELPEVHDDSKAVTALNKQALEIAQDIEREIARFFRSSATVQAEIRFYEGSIIIEGTILIMSWLGPIALAAGKKAFEAEFARVVEVATQRVLQQALRRFAPNAEPVRKIEVNPQSTPTTQEAVTESAPQPSPAPQPDALRNLPTLMMVNVGLMVIVLFLQILSALRLTP